MKVHTASQYAHFSWGSINTPLSIQFLQWMTYRTPLILLFPSSSTSNPLAGLLIPGPNRAQSCRFLCSSLRCHASVKSSTFTVATALSGSFHCYISSIHSSHSCQRYHLKINLIRSPLCFKPFKRLPVSHRTISKWTPADKVHRRTLSLPISPTSRPGFPPCSLYSNPTGLLPMLGTCWVLSCLRAFASALPTT